MKKKEKRNGATAEMKAIYGKVNVCWVLAARGQLALIIVRENPAGELAFALSPIDSQRKVSLEIKN